LCVEHLIAIGPDVRAVMLAVAEQIFAFAASDDRGAARREVSARLDREAIRQMATVLLAIALAIHVLPFSGAWRLSEV
jgi:hypothetical protein